MPLKQRTQTDQTYNITVKCLSAFLISKSVVEFKFIKSYKYISNGLWIFLQLFGWVSLKQYDNFYKKFFSREKWRKKKNDPNVNIICNIPEIRKVKPLRITDTELSRTIFFFFFFSQKTLIGQIHSQPLILIFILHNQHLLQNFNRAKSKWKIPEIRNKSHCDVIYIYIFFSSYMWKHVWYLAKKKKIYIYITSPGLLFLISGIFIYFLLC